MELVTADRQRYSGTSSPYYTDSHRRLAEFMRTYVASELLPWAQEWEEAEEVPQQVLIWLNFTNSDL